MNDLEDLELDIIEENGKYGYADKAGNIIIPYKWQEAYEFSEGLAVVSEDGYHYGFIDKTGKVVIPLEYSGAGGFSEGLAAVGKEDEGYGYIDKTGHLVIPYDSDLYDADEFKNGIAKVYTRFYEEYYIDKSGKITKMDSSKKGDIKKDSLIPFSGCLTINLFDQKHIDIVALHETGHVITMYALDMMDHFSYVTKKTGPRSLGITEMTDDYKAVLKQLGNNIIQSACNFSTGKAISQSLRISRLEAVKLYFPYICKLFGGGAICRYYKVPDENLCRIDYNLIDSLLNQFNLTGTRDLLLPLIDKYLNSIFVSLDLLTKAIYINLVKNETLQKDDVMQIIKEWEEYKLI